MILSELRHHRFITGARLLAAAAGASLIAHPAFAHHVMDGAMPASFADGLLSGLGHPIIGLDHFAFVIGAGLLCVLLPTRAQRLTLPLCFVVATAFGTSVHVAGVGLPFAELVVAGSVLALGLLLISQRRIAWPTLAGLFAIAGLFHGYAYGESIFGAEPTPVFAYLIGLTLVQYGLAIGAMAIARTVLYSDSLQATWLRVGGGVTAGVALVYLNQQLLPA